MPITTMKHSWDLYVYNEHMRTWRFECAYECMCEAEAAEQRFMARGYVCMIKEHSFLHM